MLIVVLFCCVLGLAFAQDDDGYNYARPSVLFGESISTTQCSPGYSGQYPNCVVLYSSPTPALSSYVPPPLQSSYSPQCPTGTIGQYPYCQQYPQTQHQPQQAVPVPPQCPEGTIGQYPYCQQYSQTQLQPQPQMPAPASYQCPAGTIGQYPYCQQYSQTQLQPQPQLPAPAPSQCPEGTIGQYPYCQAPPSNKYLPEPPASTPVSQPTFPPVPQPTFPPVPQPTFPLASPPAAPQLPPPSLESCLIGWEEYKTTFEKKYDDIDEELNRQELFFKNQQLIAEHNALYEKGEESYSLCVNQFSDWTEKEYQNINGVDFTELPYLSDGGRVESESEDGFGAAAEEEKKDWRDDGAVTPVKDQGSCASCWAFAATGALESHFFIKKRSLKPLSEQQLIDCSRHLGNKACNRGFYTKAFTYTQTNGILGEYEYPRYEAKENQCRATVNDLKNIQHKNITARNEDAIRVAVNSIGPVSVAINADGKFKSLGAHGVYYDSKCGKKPNHAVVVIGYGYDKKQEMAYWLIKNSYGTKWGIDGFARIARNKQNHCGVASYPAYPIV